MRRMFFSLLALSCVGAMVGCCHIAGVFDCDPDRDPCFMQGWSMGHGDVVHTGGAVPLPEIRESLPAPGGKK